MCVCLCECVWKMLFLQPSEETCGLADQKKRQKVIHLSDAVSLPNELYFYEGKRSESNTCLLLFIINSRQNTTRRSAVRN